MADERKLVQRGLTLAIFVLAVFGTAVGIVLWVKVEGADRDRAIEQLARNQAQQAAEADYDLCVSARDNREAIRASILDSDPTKLKPGDWGYAYAQEHPDEAEAAHAKLLQAVEDAERGMGPLAKFPPITCPPDPDGRG